VESSTGGKSGLGPPKSPEVELRKELWKAFVQTNVEYYVPKFLEFYLLGKKVSFNFAAFFWAPFWFFYRKMYLYGIAFYLLGLFAGILANIIAGIFGNYIYYEFTEDKVNRALLKARQIGVDPKDLLRVEGGTSVSAVLVALFFTLVLVAFAVLVAVA